MNGFLGTRAVFEVTEAFIGMESRGKQIEIRTGMGGGDCGYHFERGVKYVVYAYKNHDGILVANICSRTAPEDRAQLDLTYLRGLSKSGRRGYVIGIAGNGEGEGRVDEALGTWLPPGVPGVAVILTGQDKNARAVTGDDGLFRFDGLTPGKYNITVAKDGYSRTSGPDTLEVNAVGCAFAWETLTVDRRIAGRVTGADGLPAANITVGVVPVRPTGENQLPTPVAEIKTDSQGRYELRHLRPGAYYLGINLANTPSKQMPYTRYFYPGTEDPAAAAIVTVTEGPDSVTADFPIPAPQKERILKGFVHWSDGRPAERVDIVLEDIRWPWQTSVVAKITDSKGYFELSIFDRTSYRVHAFAEAEAGSNKELFSADPVPIGPGSDFSNPLRLALTRRGDPSLGLPGKSLERWRGGLGL